MSRLGCKPLAIHDKIKVEFKDSNLEITGPLGKLVQKIPDTLNIKIDKNSLLIERLDSTRQSNAMQGLTMGIIKNNFEGVVKGFKKDLEIRGLGYKAAVEGKNLALQIGFSHPISFAIPDGIKILIDKQTFIAVSGMDKALVGKIASDIRAFKPPEPYQGTGVRYVGERIIMKAGKAAAGAGAGAGGAKK